MPIQKTKNSKLINCPACDGLGHHLKSPEELEDYVSSEHQPSSSTTCTDCKGTGKVELT